MFIKKLFCILFGLCIHDWGKWRKKYEYSSYQIRECSKCGKKQERYVG